MINLSRLKNMREDKDLHQIDMANVLGVNRSNYSLWELEINEIPVDKLAFCADYFNSSMDYLLNLSDSKDTENLILGFDYKILGKNLKRIRIKNEYSQEYVAFILDVSPTTIGKYEKSNIKIPLNNLYKYVKLFNISINAICGKTQNSEFEEVKVKQENV